MTINSLLFHVLRNIQNTFYLNEPIRFHRHKRDLVKAISRYGYECAGRGWQMSCDKIYDIISDILKRIAHQKDSIEYLPVYLEGAITSWLNYHAEELNTFKVEPLAVLHKLTVGAPKPPPVEILRHLYIEKAARARVTHTPVSGKQLHLHL